MKLVTSLFLLCFLFSAQLSTAHGPHGHEKITEFAATGIASDVATHLSTIDGGLGFGKLPESWGKIKTGSVKLHKKGEGYFIMAVTNNIEKKTLYVLMSTTGDVYDANFSGEFEGVK